MKIKFYGHACFSIEDGKKVVVNDPYNDSIGLKLPVISANVITVSHNNEAHNNVSVIEGEPRIFNWPGEYETMGIHFKGVNSFHNAKEDKEQLENVIFTIHINGIHICHLGAQGTKLTSEQLEQVGDIDILLIPVGKTESVDAKKAKEIVEQIEPRIVIPMMYQTEGNNRGLDTLDNFLSIMGSEGIDAVDEFVVKRSELPEDNSKIVVINPA